MKPRNELFLVFILLALILFGSGELLFFKVDTTYEHPEFIAFSVLWCFGLATVLVWIGYDTWRNYEEMDK